MFMAYLLDRGMQDPRHPPSCATGGFLPPRGLLLRIQGLDGKSLPSAALLCETRQHHRGSTAMLAYISGRHLMSEESARVECKEQKAKSRQKAALMVH